MSIEELQQEINKRNYKFWHIDIFDDESMVAEIVGEMPNIHDFHKKKKQIDKQIQKVSPELRQFYCEPLLSKEQELFIFRKFNYFKYISFKKYNQYLENKTSDSECEAVKYYRQAIYLRNFIVRCNTRLAAKILKKRKDYYGDNISDLISDCFINIIKAVDGFDFRRGFKFSTYCMWVLMNNTLREHSSDKKFYESFSTNVDNGFFAEKIDENNFNSSVSFENAEGVNTDINKILQIIKEKDEREYFVLINCFGLMGQSKRTLKEISKDLNLTKERVRQIREKSIKYLKSEILGGKLNLSVGNI